MEAPRAPLHQGVNSIRQLRSQSARPNYENSKRVPRPKSGRLRNKIDSTYIYFQQKVDPIVEALVATFLFRQPVDIPSALITYFENLKYGFDPIDALGDTACFDPKRNPKMYFTASLGPVLAQLVDAIAGDMPSEVIDFCIKEMKLNFPASKKKTQLSVLDPFVAPPKRIAEQPRPSSARVKFDDARQLASNLSTGKKGSPTKVDPKISIETKTPDVVPTQRRSSTPQGVRHIQVTMLGISGAGKTSIINGLEGKFDFKIKPSIGFKPTSLMLGESTNVKFYDLGGGKKIRGIWGDYFHDVHAVIYVVDAAATEEQMEEAVSVFQATMTHKFLAGKPLLVLANKQDKEGARSVETIYELLEMKRFVHATVLPCCSYVAKGGDLEKKGDDGEERPEEDLPEFTVDPQFESALEWLLGIIQADFEDLNERVLSDSERKKKEEARKRLERERKVLRNKIAAAFRDTIDPSLLPPELPAPLPDDIFLPDEGATFLAGEIGVEVPNLEPIALEIIAMVGYQRLAMQMIGALKAPISKKKVAMTWEEIKQLIGELRTELGLPHSTNDVPPQ